VLVAVLAVSGCASAPTARPTTLTVFAASSLTDSFGAIAQAFERAHPEVNVVLSFGGSSGLAQQIVQGAPADVFATASPDTMATVGSLAAAAEVFATNTVEIAVPPGNPGAVHGLSDFARPELVIALCAAEVPCGVAATTVLSAAGVRASIDTFEQDVKAVLTKVELGEVDAGLVYRTDVLAAGNRVEGIIVPEADAAVASYPIATLTASPRQKTAKAFVAFVLSREGQRILRDAGFGD
jgi:molybdate transport system substrate-binding protein